MSSFLTKRIFSSSSPFHYNYGHHLTLLSPLLLRHSLSSQPQKPTELPFIAHYLISSFGFSPHRALKCSARSNLTAIKSSERPESVVTSLKDTGLSHDQIKAVVSFCPHLLVSNVDNHVLLRIIQRNSLLFTFDIDKHIIPVTNLLKEYELSNGDIVSLLMDTRRYFTQKLDSFRQILELVEELGILRGSRMFVCALKAIGSCSKDKIKRKLEFFMITYGWSEEEVHAAFRKFPGVLVLSENKVKSNMDFLIRIAGFESRSIARQPRLLSCSVERVLMPRYYVLSALETKGLKKKCSLLNACVLSERRFRTTYVVPFEKDLPGLDKAYSVAGIRVPV